jgi:hypothetical protein
MSTSSSDLAQRQCPCLENLTEGCFYLHVRPAPIAGAAKTIELCRHPIVNLDLDASGNLLGVEVVDVGPRLPGGLP